MPLHENLRGELDRIRMDAGAMPTTTDTARLTQLVIDLMAKSLGFAFKMVADEIVKFVFEHRDEIMERYRKNNQIMERYRKNNPNDETPAASKDITDN